MSLARGVVLGQRHSEHPLTIHVPRGAERDDREIIGRCRVAVNSEGTICGALFFEGQQSAYERHVGECARRHMDVIKAISPQEQRRGGPFDPESWDPEVDQHMLAIGRRMLAEGRMTVKPGERAGFS